MLDANLFVRFVQGTPRGNSNLKTDIGQCETQIVLVGVASPRQELGAS
jgi:UDP-N-acetyl-D-mannosaminuronic acid transferase (WecB/TagA/CpsF family)